MTLLFSPRALVFFRFTNWSWFTPSATSNKNAVERLCQVTDSVRLTVDWSKSWGWADKQARTAVWREIGEQLFADPTKIAVKNASKDLGCILHYGKCHDLLEQVDRLDIVSGRQTL